VHGFFDTPHLGMAVSHGCVRLSPANAAVLYGLVEQTGLPDTTVIGSMARSQLTDLPGHSSPETLLISI
jgi:hypothetical protein